MVEIEKENGEIWELEIEKEYDEDLGIEFTNPLIDKANYKINVSGFIDQLPPDMRKLYILKTMIQDYLFTRKFYNINQYEG